MATNAVLIADRMAYPLDVVAVVAKQLVPNWKTRIGSPSLKVSIYALIALSSSRRYLDERHAND